MPEVEPDGILVRVTVANICGSDLTPASASVRASWASTPGRDFRLTVSWVVLGIPAYFDDVEATRNHETAWRMLATLAERALDLGRESLR